MKHYKAYSGKLYYGTLVAEDSLEALREAQKQEASVDRVVLAGSKADPEPVLAPPLSSPDVIADCLTKAGMRIVWAAKHVDALLRSPDKTFGDDEKRAVEAAIDDLEYARSQLVNLRKHVAALQLHAQTPPNRPLWPQPDAITADQLREIVTPGPITDSLPEVTNDGKRVDPHSFDPAVNEYAATGFDSDGRAEG